MPALSNFSSSTSAHALRYRMAFRAAAVALPLSLMTSVAAAETGQFNSGGVPIHFTDEGAGETVIFLHGFAGSSAMWPAIGLMPLEGFRTIAFDARGHGKSGKPTDATAYGTELVDDVIRLMDERGVDAAHVVGYSMGAETALALAVEHGDRVLSVIAGGSGWSGKEEAQSYGFIATALAQSDSFGAFMAAMAPPEQELAPEAEAAMMELLAAHGIDPGQQAAPLAGVAAGLPEIISLEASALQAISAPVLGMTGENDPERANIEALAEALPVVTITVVPGADHLSAPVTPEFVSAVTDFLND
ncbi:alpha/beta fold hydrolase [Devosia sp.]|uniref:alpha/beta fold hydrolase n=1 Tax=Devosia sp. TaxID=1871048 RepID=UPI003A8F979B